MYNPKDDEQLEFADSYLSILLDTSYINKRMKSDNPIIINMDNSKAVDLLCKMYNFESNNSDKNIEDFVKNIYENKEDPVRYVYEMTVISTSENMLYEFITKVFERCNLDLENEFDYHRFNVVLNELQEKTVKVSNPIDNTTDIKEYAKTFHKLCYDNTLIEEDADIKIYTKNNDKK